MRAAVLLSLFAAGCANHRYFAPRENANGTGPDGHPAAVYAMPPPVQGDVRVWSQGTRMAEDDGVEEVELRVGFEIENTGTAVLAIEPGSIQCDEVEYTEGTLTAVRPVATEGVQDAQPGDSTRFDVVFRLPDVRGPRDVDGFTLRFRVTAAGQPLLTQVTPFVPYVIENRHGDWYGGHGWYWGSSFGFGFASHWCW